MMPSSPFLCVITDEAVCPISLAEKALHGGAAMIQLRHKTASGSQLFSWGVEITRRCRAYGALCIINDRIDIALACKADGVHLGQQDLPASAARKLLGNSRIIGVSASSPEEAIQAERDGADYIGFGHIYPTLSKEKGFDPVGPETLRRVSALVSLPIIAIGGISKSNASLVIGHGAAGIAVISAVSRAVDPVSSVQELLCSLQQGGIDG
ncbi:thiamine phosphate synthase [Chlorobium sp. KB01]|uniref:thiamine phosphate synthase n=1 Tax=Chlorobium sp. KB01 TaxID=1917528 RepID=UPI0009768451|nr:thiamine phosphate synthase [Chlorobium sp. KB01]